MIAIRMNTSRFCANPMSALRAPSRARHVADHPEITLSRREILRFILIEPTKRSEEIQTILKLEEIGQTRGALNTAQNRLGLAERNAAAQVKSSRDLLQVHL